MSPRAAANLDIELGHDENLDSAAAAQDRQVCEKLPSLGICYSGEGTYLHLQAYKMCLEKQDLDALLS